MSGPTSLRWRALRSAAFAAVATEIAALGHVVGGGTSPEVAVLIAGGAAAGAVTSGLARQRRGPGVILAAMIACQLASTCSSGSTPTAWRPAPASVPPSHYG